ncbi:MAG: hypothetical protein CV087_07970 [Candidatus Brocadia sp. WS118]|nr:MAG: hypothetical protein CV087_07970 [Candidatus Brocadia sp. WS118]
MENTSVNFVDFSKEEHIYVKGNSLADVAYQYGQQTKRLVSQTLREKLQSHTARSILAEARALLKRAHHLSQDSVFTVEGISLLSRYLTMLSAYAKGAGLKEEEIVFLQSYADAGCQTIVVRDTQRETTNFLHIEENDEDHRLVSLYKRTVKTKSIPNHQWPHLYRYRLVTWESPEIHAFFFGYPGLVGPGPAFGINYKANFVIMADTLMADTHPASCSLWANVFAFLMAESPSIAHARALFGNLKKRHIALLGGYAIHLISKEEIFSAEWNGLEMEETPGRQEGTRTYVAQTNYPHNDSLRKIDFFEKENPSFHDRQASLMVKRRTVRLWDAARTFCPSSNAPEDIKRLASLIKESPGDIETFDYGAVPSGLHNPTSAAYLVGSISPSDGNITIGKMSPGIGHKDQPVFFYTKASAKSATSEKNVDLAAHTAGMLLSDPSKITVAIVYSTASARAQQTDYAATDDDTAYVANKVREALETKQLRVQMVPVTEENIATLKDLLTDVVFNLIEWTGKDVDLSKQVFKHLRKLNIPITGASEKNFMETTDKIVAKRLFKKYGIPTPEAQAFVTGDEPISTTLPFPVIVKPATEHGSIGLTRSAVVSSSRDLQAVVKNQITQHTQPALAEEFIEGRELLVYLYENRGTLMVLPIEEILFANDKTLTFQTYESKWDPNHNDFANTVVTLAQLNPKELAEVKRVAKRVFKKLGFRGYGRIDIRLRHGTPYVLEANANPNIYDSDEDQIPGIAFPDFVFEIVMSALLSYSRGWKI